MKKTILLIVSILIVWGVCSGVMLLLDFGMKDALIIGFASAMGGVFAPIIMAWLDKTRSKCGW